MEKTKKIKLCDFCKDIEEDDMDVCQICGKDYCYRCGVDEDWHIPDMRFCKYCGDDVWDGINKLIETLKEVKK